MPLPDPRRIAAADMYGLSGSLRRRRLIRAEFVVGAAGCAALGVASVLGGGLWSVVGVWLIGIGANYVPLALAAQRLAAPGVLDRHMAGREIRAELRQAARAQLWILVPFSLCVAALRNGRDGSRG